MATKVKCTFKKSSSLKGAAKGKAFAAGDPVASFTITDDPNSPNNYKVWATNAAGDLLDVSGVAGITVAADASGNASFNTTGPDTFAAQGNKQGSATATITMTWTDGSVGPFTGDVAFTVTPGGPTGFTVQPA